MTEIEKSLRGQIYQLVLEKQELSDVIKAQKEEWGDAKGYDRPLSIQDKIEKAHPHFTKDFKTYEMALKMVGAKHSKYGLVDLVNYLLSVIKKWETQNQKLILRVEELEKL